MSPKVMLFLWLLLYGSISRGRRWTETCAGSLVCKIMCKIVFSVCEGWKGARRCLQRAEVAGTGDSGRRWDRLFQAASSSVLVASPSPAERSRVSCSCRGVHELLEVCAVCTPQFLLSYIKKMLLIPQEGNPGFFPLYLKSPQSYLHEQFLQLPL